MTHNTIEPVDIICTECGNEFTVPVSEQKWLILKGYKMPKRCRKCRAERRKERIDDSGTGEVERGRQEGSR